MSQFKNRQGLLSLIPNTLIAISEGTRLLEYRSKIHDKNYPNGILLKRLAFSLKTLLLMQPDSFPSELVTFFLHF